MVLLEVSVPSVTLNHMFRFSIKLMMKSNKGLYMPGRFNSDQDLYLSKYTVYLMLLQFYTIDLRLQMAFKLNLI